MTKAKRTTTKINDSSCPLLSLPPELRNSIYNYVLSSITESRVNERGLIPHALARTCHQTRDEFLPMCKYLDETTPNTLKARVTDFDFKALMAYLQWRLPSKTRYLE